MRLGSALSAVVAATFSLHAWAQPTVTLTLDSSKDGQTVVPGATIDWTISIEVSTGDNAGLALLACDLVQDPANPAKLDIPPGDEASIDATMQNFSRPAGIANPGEGGATTGYVGVQRGTAGEMNLLQIGGGQNSFGTALPPGTGVGETADIIAGVGQGTAPQVVVSGSFTAPDTPGPYVFYLDNVVANVLDVVNPPPAFSPVVGANVDTVAASFGFRVLRVQSFHGGFNKQDAGQQQHQPPPPLP